MFFKIIGACIVVFSGFLLGYTFLSNVSKRINELTEIKAKLHLIRAQMSFLHTELKEIFFKLGDFENKVVENFFKEVLTNHQFEQGIEVLEQSSFLSTDDIKVIKDFLNLFGKTDMESQINNLDYILNALNLKIDALILMRDNKGKIIMGSSVGSAIVIAILMLN